MVVSFVEFVLSVKLYVNNNDDDIRCPTQWPRH